MTGVGTATVDVTLAPGAPLHQRITQLEAKVSALRTELDGALTALRKEIQKVRRDSEAGLRAQGKENAETRSRLEEFAVGGLHIEWFGIVWLVVGTLFTNIPEAIVALWRQVL
jgi:hypothetical protein